MENQDINSSFWRHVEELRQTCILILITISVGLTLSLLFYQSLFSLLTLPLSPEQSLYILGPTDGISTTLKTCLWVGTAATSPIWTFLILRFIAPALHTKERKLIIPFVFFSAALMLVGLFFAYTVTIPLANQFLNTFNQGLGTNLWSFSNYLNYTLILLLSNAIAFEFFVILLFLVHYRIVSSQTLEKVRRYVIVSIFILSAVLTPPDILTQIMLALPLIGLYESAILYGRLKAKVAKKRPSCDHL